MKRSDIGAGSVLALAAAWSLLWLIPTQTSPAQSETTMSPAMMPSLAAGVVLALAVLLAAGQVLSAEPASEQPHEEFGGETRGFGRTETIELAMWIVAAIVAILLMVHVSFVVAGGVLLVAATLLMGQRNVWTLAITALGVPFALNLAAWHLFGVAMP
ncbi:MAG: tripartite tricarboxylate transporter TctB family protein [Hyphomicrobiaceae bacterium]